MDVASIAASVAARHLRRRIDDEEASAAILTVILSVIAMASVLTGPAAAESTRVPGHDRYDTDDNGISDAGVYVNGHYTSGYAYDANGDWYWDLGDGRVYGTVGSVDDLADETLTVCDYVVNYRADFGNTPFMDEGSIQNHIRCRGYDDNNHYNYLIVSQNDRRYTGNPAWAIWNTWEYHVLTISGEGNLTGPQSQIAWLLIAESWLGAR